MSPTELAYWLVFCVGTMGAFFNPVCGVLLYVLVYQLYPETQWWGYRVGELVPRTMFVIALATGIGLILKWQRFGQNQRQFPPVYMLMLLFLLYAFLISVTGSAPLGHPESRVKLDKFMRICIFVFMMIRSVRTAAHFRWLLWAWMAGTIYIGYQAWSGIGITVSGRLSHGLGGPDFNQSSGLAAHLVPMVAIAGFLYFSSNSKRAKFFALLAAAFAVNTIILTRTRNAFPGMVVLIIFGLMRLPRGVRLRCALGIIVGLALSLKLTDGGWWRRMETLKNPAEDPSISRRYDYWRAAISMAADHPFGVGVGGFRYHVFDYVTTLDEGRSAHSTYFQCLAEMGYPGLLLFLAIVAAALYQLERARAVGRYWRDYVELDAALAEDMKSVHLLATANEVAVIGFMVSAAFTSRLWVEGMWLLLAMSCCLLNTSQSLRERLCNAEAEAAAEPPSLQPQLAGLPC